MRVTIFAVILLAIAACVQAASVTNGSFEAYNLSSGSYCINQNNNCPSGGGWSGEFHVANMAGAIYPPSTPPDGTHYAMLQTTNTMYQSIYFDVAGSYLLTWYDAGRTGYSSAGGNQTYEVKISNATISTKSTVSNRDWAQHTASFVVSAPGNLDLKFVGQNPNGGDQSSLIDAVSLSYTGAAVPEPASFAFAAAGLGVVVALRRR